MHFPSCAVTCVFLGLIASSTSQQETWINPPPYGFSGDILNWQVGSSQTFKWSTDYEVLSILLWPVPQQGTNYERILDKVSGRTEYTWTVSTKFDLSNSFFFGLYNDTPSTSSEPGASFKSQNFNIVSAVSSSSTSTTSTRSTSTSTSTTTTSTITSSTPSVSPVTTTQSSASTQSPTGVAASPTPLPTGLTRSTVVGLGVGLGIGIPLILLAGILIGFKLRNSKRKERSEYGIDYSGQSEALRSPGVDYAGGVRQG